MRVLIVEDVTLIAERIADLANQFLPDCKIRISHTLEDAKLCILEEQYDLLFLDLNLNGKDGFDLLHSAAAATFQTVIITANREQASLAFDYGVLDFISKPILEKRFKMAVDRFLSDSNPQREALKYLAIKSRGQVQLIDIEEVEYIKASGNYSEVITHKKECFIHDKNLDKLLKILPRQFLRVHRSYIIPKRSISKVLKHGGGKYSIVLVSGEEVPLSRVVYKEFFTD
jgi:DNA-binding LytR/AlgR family response regulator